MRSRGAVDLDGVQTSLRVDGDLLSRDGDELLAGSGDLVLKAHLRLSNRWSRLGLIFD